MIIARNTGILVPKYLVLLPSPGTFPDNSATAFAIPGLHIVANFSVDANDLLCDYTVFQRFINEQIVKFGLSKVGEVYHNFPAGGFTGVVCLTESHLSIHTWPELRYVTFDVFLSNYMKDNRETTRALYATVQKFLGGRVVLEKIIER